MLLAVSRSPSSIPRRSPCLERCHLPLAFLYTSTSQNPKNIPDCIHSRSDATFLWRPSTTSTSQNLKNIHDCIHSRSDAFFPWRPSTISTSQNLKNIPACIHPRSDITFLWRPSPSFSQNLKSIPDCIHRAIPPSSDVPQPHPYTPKKSPASSYSKDTGLPSVIYKLEMRLELTTPSLRVKCSTD